MIYKALMLVSRLAKSLSRACEYKVKHRRHALNVQRAIWKAKQKGFVHFASVLNTALPSSKHGGTQQ